MKHPQYRVSDVWAMAKFAPEVFKDVMEKLNGVKPYLHPYIRERMVRFEWCGSGVFGNNKLRSDWDVNIKMRNWDEQVMARRIYMGNVDGNFRAATDYFLQLQKDGFPSVDLGCVDADTDKYNIHVSLDDGVLHHRYSEYPEVFRADINGIIWEREDRPVDLINPPEEQPPIANIHLQWNTAVWRWQRKDLNGSLGQPAPVISYQRNKPAEWADDPYASEVEKWKGIYGDMFQGYHEVNGILVQD